ncbi:MAG: RNA-binding protein [Kiloniellaceae bacterium]
MTRRIARRSGVWRRCIATGQVRPKRALIRFVAAPDGTVVADLAGRLPGRGLWLSARRDMIDRACARNLFAKAAKAPLKVPDDLAGQVERLLVRRCLDLLGLAKRAGQVAAGHDRVKSWLAAGNAALLIQAADGCEDGRRGLVKLARATDPEMPVVESFTAEELGQVLGHGAWVHVAVAPGGVADRLALETARLMALRGQPNRLDRYRASEGEVLDCDDDA